MKLFVFMVAMLFGCSADISVEQKEDDYQLGENKYVQLWRDPETGCEYISNTKSDSLTPRLNRSGNQICR